MFAYLIWLTENILRRQMIDLKCFVIGKQQQQQQKQMEIVLSWAKKHFLLESFILLGNLILLYT